MVWGPRLSAEGASLKTISPPVLAGRKKTALEERGLGVSD